MAGKLHCIPKTYHSQASDSDNTPVTSLLGVIIAHILHPLLDRCKVTASRITLHLPVQLRTEMVYHDDRKLVLLVIQGIKKLGPVLEVCVEKADAVGAKAQPSVTGRARMHSELDIGLTWREIGEIVHEFSRACNTDVDVDLDPPDEFSGLDRVIPPLA